MVKKLLSPLLLLVCVQIICIGVPLKHGVLVAGAFVALGVGKNIVAMPLKILSQDWSGYESRKSDDVMVFACEEKWEVDFLVNTILRVYPENTEASIRIAIAACCLSMPRPRPRNKLVTCVMSRL